MVERDQPPDSAQQRRPHTHVAASRTNMSLRALVDHDLICLPRGSGIRASLDEGCATARLQCRVALEASNPEVVADLAALGLGVAVLPESYARTRDDLHLLRLGRPTLHAYVGVAWRAHGRLPVAATALVTLWQNRHSASSGGPA